MSPIDRATAEWHEAHPVRKDQPEPDELVTWLMHRLALAEQRAHRMEQALRFEVSEPFALDGQFVNLSGPELLRLLAVFFDRHDEVTGNPRRVVQNDLRRWAEEVEAAL